MSDVTATTASPATLPLVHGTVVEKGVERLLLALPGTDYKLLLMLAPGVSDRLPEAGSPQRVAGTIHAQARRIDVIPKGGRYIEPVHGRPRRVQGRIMALPKWPEVAGVSGVIAVQCAPGCVMLIKPMKPQTSADFAQGQLVSFDVEPGSRFEPIYP